MATIRSKWMVSPGYDLTFFVGGAALTLILLGLWSFLEQWGLMPRATNILLVYFIFVAFFDHPHIFQTFSRTHLDGEEFRRRKPLYTWGLAGFIAIGLVLTALGFERELIVFAALYGSWHIIMQHKGLMLAYKGLNRDFTPLDDVLDKTTLLSGLFACMAHDYTDLHGPETIFGTLSVQFPSVPPEVSQALWGVFFLAAGLLVARQIQLIMTGVGLNLPKLVLMATALGTHYLVFFATSTPFLVAEALETVYHNIQYQGFMRHYQTRRFGRDVAKRWAWMALAYGTSVAALEIVTLVDRRWTLLFVPFSMLVIFHYYVDGKIWKFGRDPVLKTLLFASGPATGRSPGEEGLSAASPLAAPDPGR